MKYLTYIYDGVEAYGVAINGNVYKMKDINPAAPCSLVGFIESGIKTPDNDTVLHMGAKPVPLADVKVLAPIPYPRREIICLGRNYLDHVNEIKTDPNRTVPEIPVYFGKRAYPANSPGGRIPLHTGVTEQIDYEVELAAVVGKQCENVAEADAFDYIFGYTIINDVSARDLQTRHNQWYLGKSLAGYCPMGPYIADKNEIPDPGNVNITSRVNGETRQKSNTRMMIFPIAFCISQLSRGFTLLPGDIVATGTPAGVGHGFDPPRHLKQGDVVECEADGVGVLTNYVG